MSLCKKSVYMHFWYILFFQKKIYVDGRIHNYEISRTWLQQNSIDKCCFLFLLHFCKWSHSIFNPLWHMSCLCAKTWVDINHQIIEKWNFAFWKDIFFDKHILFLKKKFEENEKSNLKKRLETKSSQFDPKEPKLVASIQFGESDLR